MRTLFAFAIILSITLSFAQINKLTTQLSYGRGFKDLVHIDNSYVINGKFVYDTTSQTVQAIVYDNVCDTKQEIIRNDQNEYYCLFGSELRKVKLDSSFKPSVVKNFKFNDPQDVLLQQGDIAITIHNQQLTSVATIRIFNMTTDEQLHEKYIELRLLNIGSQPKLRHIAVNTDGLFFGVFGYKNNQDQIDYFYQKWSELTSAQKIDQGPAEGPEGCFYVQSLSVFLCSDSTNVYDDQEHKAIQSNLTTILHDQIMDGVFTASSTSNQYQLLQLKVDSEKLTSTPYGNPIPIAVSNTTGDQFFSNETNEVMIGDYDAQASYVLDVANYAIKQVGGGSYPSIYFAGLNGGATINLYASGYVIQSSQGFESHQNWDLSKEYVEYFIDSTNDDLVYGLVRNATANESISETTNTIIIFDMQNSTITEQLFPGTNGPYNTFQKLDDGSFQFSYSYADSEQKEMVMKIHQGDNIQVFAVPVDEPASKRIQSFNYNESNQSLTTVEVDQPSLINKVSLHFYDLSGKNANNSVETTWSGYVHRINNDIVVALDGSQDFAYVFSFSQNEVIQTFDFQSVAGVSIAAVGVDMSKYPNAVGAIVYSNPKDHKVYLIDDSGKKTEVGYDMYGNGAAVIIEEVGRDFGFKVSTPGAAANLEVVYQYTRSSSEEIEVEIDQEVVFLGIM